MKPFGLTLLLTVLAVVLVLPGLATATESATSSSATAIIDFIQGDLDHFSCQPVCPGPQNPNAPFIPPIPVTTLAECEAHCRSVCNVSSCNLIPPPISPTPRTLGSGS
jgi:hypothetical protein